MKVVPITLREANALVASMHRHHKPVQGQRFALGLQDGSGQLIGAAVVGRPVARHYAPEAYAEVTRLVTDGTANACSVLYGAAARVCKAMGFVCIQTYILESEPGTSLKASGWELAGKSQGGDGWQSRPGRRTDQPTEPKQRWVKWLDLSSFSAVE